MHETDSSGDSNSDRFTAANKEPTNKESEGAFFDLQMAAIGTQKEANR